MRAVLVLIVLVLWAACLLGAVGLTAYLAVTAVGGLRRRHAGVPRSSSRPSRAAVIALVVFAAIMVAFAVMASGVFWGQTPIDWSSTLGWAAMPSWAALVAVLTAIVLWRRRRVQRWRVP